MRGGVRRDSPGVAVRALEPGLGLSVCWVPNRPKRRPTPNSRAYERHFRLLAWPRRPVGP
eukprot:scaffold1248_cov170-Amphora_coffeaeformis.AAC.5